MSTEHRVARVAGLSGPCSSRGRRQRCDEPCEYVVSYVANTSAGEREFRYEHCAAHAYRFAERWDIPFPGEPPAPPKKSRRKTKRKKKASTAPAPKAPRSPERGEVLSSALSQVGRLFEEWVERLARLEAAAVDIPPELETRLDDLEQKLAAVRGRSDADARIQKLENRVKGLRNGLDKYSSQRRAAASEDREIFERVDRLEERFFELRELEEKLRRRIGLLERPPLRTVEERVADLEARLAEEEEPEPALSTGTDG